MLGVQISHSVDNPSSCEDAQTPNTPRDRHVRKHVQQCSNHKYRDVLQIIEMGSEIKQK